MSLAFNEAAVHGLFDSMLSTAAQLGIFGRTPINHEPKNAPGAGMSLALWWNKITPYPRGSGLASVSGVVTFSGRIYKSFLSKPEDDTDPDLMTATCTLLAAYAGGFTLDGQVRNIDLLGESGQAMSATAGYIEHDGKLFRVAECLFPVIISDLWTEAP